MTSQKKSSDSPPPENGKTDTRKPKHTPKLIPLAQRIHPAARALFEHTPVLWFESREAYDALLYALLDEYNPMSITEAIIVKDLADCHWELVRYQRIRRAAVTLQVPESAWKLLSLTIEREARKHGLRFREDIDRMLNGVVNGLQHSRDILKSLQEAGNVSNETLLYEAYTRGLGSLAAIDAALHRAERRRMSLLRLMEQRRIANAAVNKAYWDGLPWQLAPLPTHNTESGGENDEEI